MYRIRLLVGVFALFVLRPCLSTADEVQLKTVTLVADRIPLSRALAELKKQTDMSVEDRREPKDDPEIKLHLDKVSFWKAADAIAKAANARLSLYERDGKLALVRGPWRQERISYSGMFRIVLKQLAAVHDFDAEAHYLRATLEIAWEPRFRPLLIETRPRGLVMQDDDNHQFTDDKKGGGLAAPERPSAMTLDLRLPAPPRSARKIKLLRGELTAVGSVRMLEFTFGTVAELKAGEKTSPPAQEGVSARVTKVTVDSERWSVEVALQYPPGGPKFESFQSWVVNNEMYLENAGRRYPNNGGSSETTADSRATVSYHFVDDRTKGLKRGDTSKWTVKYLTPAAIHEVPLVFEFREVTLP
jgi:hypothetical protein